MKKALIFDLDNTIYPVSSIADGLFPKLFALLDENGGTLDKIAVEKAKDELTRRHYHLVADEFNFAPELKAKGIRMLSELTYDLPMQPFDDYHQLKTIPVPKFLVTTGFTKLQWSKVKMLGIEPDFDEIHIVDPEVSNQTKKDVFADIMQRHGYLPADVLIIGDDPASEIQAATALEIDTFLFDPNNMHDSAKVTYRSKRLADVLGVVS